MHKLPPTFPPCTLLQMMRVGLPQRVRVGDRPHESPYKGTPTNIIQTKVQSGKAGVKAESRTPEPIRLRACTMYRKVAALLLL